MSWAEHSVEIAAPIETSFDAIVDYESFHGWLGAVDSAEILSRTADGIGEDVHLFVDAKVRKIDYVLRYRYERPTSIEWDFVEGNGMRDVDGAWSFERLGPDRTRVTYKLGADPEIPVPGMVMRRVHKGLVKDTVEELKGEAERRAATVPEAETDSDEEGAAEPAERTEEAIADTAAAATGGGWEPKATREARERRAVGADGRDAGSSESWRDMLDHAPPLAGRPLKGALDLAQSAVRAGRSVAGLGLEIGREVADRVDRALSGERPPDDR